MRMVACALVLAPTFAAADDTTRIRVRRLEASPDVPLLHLPPLTADAQGGQVDHTTTVIELGPRARFTAEGRWWRTGLAPSMFESDLTRRGWRVAGELSYDLGPFSTGVDASLTRDGESSHRSVGLFAFKGVRLSRWTKVWIVLGVSWEQFNGSQTGTGVGLKIGGTFR